jgi:flavorubredoxin
MSERHKSIHDVVRSCTLPLEAIDVHAWLFMLGKVNCHVDFILPDQGIGSSAVQRKDNNSMGHSHLERTSAVALKWKRTVQNFLGVTFSLFTNGRGIVITNRKKVNESVFSFHFSEQRDFLWNFLEHFLLQKASNKAKVYHDSTMMPFCAPT